MFQEKKLQDEIKRLNAELNERDTYIESRRNEITTMESVISQSREGFSHHKAQRDKMQDERKYESFVIFILDEFSITISNMTLLTVFGGRSLWRKETELSAEIEKLRTEVEKAEKSLDHATPGVSNCFLDHL